MIEVIWICATGNHPVGIVKQFDKDEERWKYYIGTGNGYDLEADVQKILATGQKSYSLEHILEFWEEDSEKVVRCKDCSASYKSAGSSTGWRCKCWGVHDTDCEVSPDGFCYKAERRTNEEV